MANDIDRMNGNFDYPDDEQLDRVLAEIDEIKRTIRSLPDGERILAGGVPVQNYGAPDRAPAYASDPELRASVERLVRSVDELARTSRETDRRFSDEINLIKNQIYKLSGKEDVSTALGKLGGSVKRAEEAIIGVNGAIEALSSVERASTSSTDTELLRQLYEIKTLVGAPSAATEKRNEGLCELYNLLAKVKCEAKRESASVTEKFTAVDALRRRLEETDELDVAPIAEELNAIIDKLVALPLDLTNFDDVLSYARSGDAFAVAPSRKESVRSYLTSVSSLMSGGAANGIDDLPDLIAAKNGIQSNRNEFKCESVYSAILNTNIAILSEKDEAKLKSLRAELTENVRNLTALEVCDLVDYPHVELRRPARTNRAVNTEGLFDRLTEIKNLLLDANVSGADKIVATDDEETAKVDAESVSRAILDLKGDCLAILDKLGDKEADEDGAAPTIGEIVVQLDRLFEDVKNLVTDSENNVMSSIEVLGDAVASLSATTAERAQACKDDRIKILEGINILTGGTTVPAEGAHTASSELEIRLKDVERRQRALMNAVETNALEAAKRAEENKAAIIAAFDEKAAEMSKAFDNRLVAVLQAVEHTATLASAAFVAPEPAMSGVQTASDDKTVLAEIKKLREQLFAITMANVSEDDKARYESYNSIILNEIYDLADDISDIREELDNHSTDGEIAARLTDGIAAIENKLNAAIDGKSNDDVIGELNKLKEEIAKAPARRSPTGKNAKTTLPRKTVPASVRRRNAPKSLSGNLSVDEILSRIGDTRIGDENR